MVPRGWQPANLTGRFKPAAGIKGDRRRIAIDHIQKQLIVPSGPRPFDRRRDQSAPSPIAARLCRDPHSKKPRVLRLPPQRCSRDKTTVTPFQNRHKGSVGSGQPALPLICIPIGLCLIRGAKRLWAFLQGPQPQAPISRPICCSELVNLHFEHLSHIPQPLLQGQAVGTGTVTPNPAPGPALCCIGPKGA